MSSGSGEAFTKIQTPKGTRDLLPDELAKRQLVEDSFRKTFKVWGYREVRTPTLEYFEALTSGVGAELQNSMFIFQDRGGRLLALRAEMTAPVARVVSTELTNEPRPLRLYYLCTLFRYDEPQAGRQREFWQAGTELLGSSSPKADAESLVLMLNALENIGLRDVQIDVGHVGLYKAIVRSYGIDEATSNQIRVAIDKKDMPGLDQILEMASIGKTAKDILRLLPTLRGGVEILDKISGFSEEASVKKSLEDIRTTLKEIGSFGALDRINLNLGIIRGIAYYTGVVFEAFVPELGIAIGAGGRYDELVKEFGKTSIPSVGFAIGIDRCMLALEKQSYEFRSENVPKALVVAFEEELSGIASAVASELRKNNVSAETDVTGWKLSRYLSYANRKKIPYTVIVAPKEWADKEVLLKDMVKGSQEQLSVKELIEALRMR
jgi:ATP phosphoribosyltransferase regulatory subunit